MANQAVNGHRPPGTSRQPTKDRCLAGWLSTCRSGGRGLQNPAQGTLAGRGGTNHLTLASNPSSLQAPGGGPLSLSCPVCPTLSYLAPLSLIKATPGVGWNLDNWASCREGAQKVTWEVMQELEAWELLPTDFLMPLGEHARSLNTA